MLKLERQVSRPNARVQASWRQGELPHFSGILTGDGRMVVMDEMVVMTDGQALHHVSPICESSVESFDAFSGENVDVTPLVPALDLGGNMEAVCGEGAMGNEGFVSVLSQGLLLWSAFFTTSNPFYKLRLGHDGTLITVSTHEVEWHFPLDAPWEVSTRTDSAES